MKLLKTALLASAAVVLMAGAAKAVSTTGSATATIVKQLSVEENREMDFASTVQTNPAQDSIIYTDGTSLNNATIVKGTLKSGRFAVNGEPSTDYDISLTNPVMSDAALTLEVAGPDSGHLNASGADTFLVNGKLTVPAGKTGTFTGIYDVNVNY